MKVYGYLRDEISTVHKDGEMLFNVNVVIAHLTKEQLSTLLNSCTSVNQLGLIVIEQEGKK